MIIYTVDSQKIVQSKFCEFTENQFLCFFNFANWPQQALIIANFDFASEARR